MSRMGQLILALLLGLGLLTWAASGLVETTARDWFERDAGSRAHLVLTGARQSLAHFWYSSGSLQEQLTNLAHDERVMAAAACDPDLSTRVATSAFPEEFNCVEVGARVLVPSPGIALSSPVFREWSTISLLPTSRVYVTSMPISSGGRIWALSSWCRTSATSSSARTRRAAY